MEVGDRHCSHFLMEVGDRHCSHFLKFLWGGGGGGGRLLGRNDFTVYCLLFL